VLSEAQIQRYSRHILLREVGGTGQQLLLRACVRVTALDEGGRAAALWLARAGLGAIVFEEDRRPVLTLDGSGLLLAADIGRPMSEAVRERLRFHAPDLRFEGVATADVAGGGTALDGIQAAIAAMLGLLRGGRT
jgi:adenylyltransferase/sulfurtransferase